MVQESVMELNSWLQAHNSKHSIRNMKMASLGVTNASLLVCGKGSIISLHIAAQRKFRILLKEEHCKI